MPPASAQTVKLEAFRSDRLVLGNAHGTQLRMATRARPALGFGRLWDKTDQVKAKHLKATARMASGEACFNVGLIDE